MNPYGLDLPRGWLETLTMPLTGLIEEHAPLVPWEPVGVGVASLAAFYVVVLLGVLPGRLRIAWFLPLVWFALAALRVRNAPLFGVTAVIALADMLPHSRVGQWLRRREMFCPTAAPALVSCPSPVERARGAVLMPLAVVAVALAIQIANVRFPVVGRGWARFDSERWPVALLPKLDEINRSGADGQPIFNDMLFGGFLIYYEPRLRVFVDDRCALYGTEFLQTYDRARRGEAAEIERWRRQYGFRHALVEANTPFDRYLSQTAGWFLLGRAPNAALYEHK